jgi:hypothetical protein
MSAATAEGIATWITRPSCARRGQDALPLAAERLAVVATHGQHQADDDVERASRYALGEAIAPRACRPARPVHRRPFGV